MVAADIQRNILPQFFRFKGKTKEAASKYEY
jgi:hypothetical protein